jgi:histidyl-tRNA synthetase
MQKPGIPQGTRDFGPEKMIKRNFIFENIKVVFQKFGFQPLETPAIENLSVLMGKYGEEGDRLLFKILNSGPYLEKTSLDDFNKGSSYFTTKIAEKGLRYDLTVPFARYVVMNRNEITFPFKRYQMQPVWRGDRPQKGRYREFYQCDADVVGTDSLLCEAEIVLMIQEVFDRLGLKDFTIKINNRKILEGIAIVHGMQDQLTDLTVAIDKLDKIGREGVVKELSEKGVNKAVQVVDYFINYQNKGNNKEKLEFLKQEFTKGSVLIGLKGVEEMEKILLYVNQFLSTTNVSTSNVEFDITLARGLSYYTGAIFEVKANNVSIGSICGGGRYDNLTGVFGLPGVSGVGISFGVDRIYDVLEELKLFPEGTAASTKVLLCYFDEASEKYSLPLLYQLRKAGINSEVYPEAGKLKKPLNYANSKSIPYAIIIGSDEIVSGLLTLKDMLKGEQERLTISQIIDKLQ